MFSCDLTLTDLIGDDTLRESLRRGEELVMESLGRSWRETMCDRRRISPDVGDEMPVALRNAKLVAISRSLCLLYDGK